MNREYFRILTFYSGLVAISVLHMSKNVYFLRQNVLLYMHVSTAETHI